MLITFLKHFLFNFLRNQYPGNRPIGQLKIEMDVVIVLV